MWGRVWRGVGILKMPDHYSNEVSIRETSDVVYRQHRLGGIRDLGRDLGRWVAVSLFRM